MSGQIQQHNNCVSFGFSKNSILYIFAHLFGYFLSLLYVYGYGISVIYNYAGFVDNFSLNNLFYSVFLLLFISPLLRSNGLPSGVFINLMVLIVFVPSLVLYVGAGLPDAFIITTFMAIILVVLSSRIIVIKRLKLTGFYPSRLIVPFVLIIVLTLFGIIYFGGLSYLNFDISVVYEIRKEAAENLPGFFGYMNSIATKVLIPFAIVFSLKAKRWMTVILCAGLSVIFFGLTAHKSPILYPFVAIFIYFGAKNSWQAIQNIRNALLVIVIISAIDSYLYFQNGNGLYGWFSSLFTRRAILVPSLLNWYYIDFFSSIKKYYYWADSKLTMGLIQSPFDVRSVNLIGDEYFGRKEMSANTGWIGSGYANAGIYGVVIYSLLIGGLLAFLDAYARKIGGRLVIALFFLPILTIITSTDLTTMILTHGLAVALCILMFLELEPGHSIANNV